MGFKFSSSLELVDPGLNWSEYTLRHRVPDILGSRVTLEDACLYSVVLVAGSELEMSVEQDLTGFKVICLIDVQCSGLWRWMFHVLSCDTYFKKRLSRHPKMRWVDFGEHFWLNMRKHKEEETKEKGEGKEPRNNRRESVGHLHDEPWCLESISAALA